MSSIIDIVKKHRMESARQQGHKENAIAIASDMEKAGFPVERIIKFTKLPRKEIEEL